MLLTCDWTHMHDFLIVTFSTIDTQNFHNAFVVLGAYATLGFIYLVFVPLLLYFWMNTRWNFMGKYERLVIYGLVFLFFPGFILASPFLNLRMNGQGEV